jgi:hypothetical protein
MMELLVGLLLLSAGWPFWRLWQANRHTALAHTVLWAGAAWVAWSLNIWLRVLGPPSRFAMYLALCLTACAVVALLGARRPGVVAWNLVVAGLLAVTLMPVAQRHLAGGTLTLDVLQMLLLASILAVGLINYLPTRVAAAAALLFFGCLWNLWGLGQEEPIKAPARPIAEFAVGCAPWLACLTTRRPVVKDSAFDRLWLAFRDRFGLVWSQRVREQFNRSAANSGWPVILTWKGLRRKPGTAGPDSSVPEQMLDTLHALLKRFI